MDDCLQCKTIAKENNEKAMESEITRLREQVAKQTDDLNNMRERFLSFANKRLGEIAALAEQNEKMRVFLDFAWRDIPMSDYAFERLEEALSLPDLATPALNRIRAEGMRMAAEICQEVGEDGDGMAGEIWVERCRNAIRARADELYPEV